MTLKIEDIQIGKTSFQNDWRRLPLEVKAEASRRLSLLVADTSAGKIRFHKLNGFRPGLYSIDLSSGKGKRYKATFEMHGSSAVFQRAGTHK